MNSAFKTTVVSLALLTAFAARAEGPRFGLQLHYVAPSRTAMYHTNSLRHADGEKMFDGFLSSGFGASATFEWGLVNSGAVRARLEYLTFGDKAKEKEEPFVIFDRQINFSYGMNYSIKVAGLAADYVLGFKSLDAGPYVFGGLGYYSAKGSGRFFGQDWDMLWRDSMEGSGASVGLSIGAGWRFTENKGCELHYTTLNDLKQTVKYGPHSLVGPEENHKIDLNWLQVSFCYRF